MTWAGGKLPMTNNEQLRAAPYRTQPSSSLSGLKHALEEQRMSFLIRRLAPVLCLPACLTAFSARAELGIEVRNGHVERFQQVVSHTVTEGQAAAMKGKRLVEVDVEGTAIGTVASALDRSGPEPVLVWLLPGITTAGSVRRLKTVPEEDAPPLPSADRDLHVTVSDKTIGIRNTYLGVEHPRRGGGGFPKNMTFALSGNRDGALHFLDRLYRRKTREQYYAHSDPDSTATVVFRDPLRVVVESRLSYTRGSARAPGHPKAVYRYVYTPYSPVIDVSVEAERSDDEPWNEFHFLHLSRDEFHYTSFVTGEPPREIPMLSPGQKSVGHGGTWGVMATQTDAAGVGFDAIRCWDAADEFVYYVHCAGPAWNGRRRRQHGGIYLGPSAGDPAWYSRWLGPTRQLAVRLQDRDPDVHRRDETPAGAHELQNEAMRVVFAGQEAGFDCLAIENLLRDGARFVNPREQTAGLWKLEFRTPHRSREGEAEGAAQTVLCLDNRAPGPLTSVFDQWTGAQALTLTWRDLDLGQETDVVDVTVTVKLPTGRGGSEWRINVDNRSRRFGLWEVHFPYLSTVSPPGSADLLRPGGNWGGVLVKGNKSGMGVPYPSTACPAQFMAFNRGQAGLYLGAHDGQARAKHLHVSPDQDATFSIYAEDMGVPGSDFPSSFPVVIAAYRGDWWQAARIYRQWATQQAWTRKGWIQDRKDIPLRFKEMGLWMLLNGAPEKVKPTMMEADALCDVPVGVHWYCWHQIPFDHTYPEYFPTKPGFAGVTRFLTARNQLVMPYINGRLWDRDIPSFATGITGACKQPSMEPYTEVYGSGRRLAPMCPVTALWQDKVNEVCRRLIHDCGVNGIYLDQIGAARPKLCFDPAHGHPLGGGRHWVDGYRVMLNSLKREAAANDVALTTENTAEPYMDNIDGYLAWIQRNDNDVPLLPAVYSGYTIYFTSPQDAKDDLNAFAMAQGRDFLWGCQLGWNGDWILAESHREKLDFQLELCRIRLAAKEFMVYGQLLDEIRPTRPVPLVSADWHRRKKHAATLPAVQGTLWRSRDNQLAVFLVNYGPLPCRIEYLLEPSRWIEANGSKAWLLSRITGRGTTPWEIVRAGTIERADVLRPHQILAFAIRPARRPDDIIKSAEKSVDGLSDPDLRKATQGFLFRTELAGLGLDLAPPLPIRDLVRGEPAELQLAFSNTQRRERTVSLSWPDGQEDTVTVPGRNTRQVRHVFWPDGDDLAGDLAESCVTVGLPRSGLSRAFPVWFRITPALEVRMGSLAGARGGESLLVPVEVRNNSRMPREGTLALGLPPGWTAEPGAAVALGRLQPGERRSLLFRCEVPPAKSTLKTSISVHIVEQGEQRQITVAKSRPALSAPTRRAPPVIDGRLDDWPNAATIRLGAPSSDTVRIAKQYGGAADCSAHVKLAWDTEHLYLAAAVRDNVHCQDQTDAAIWQGDCIQLAFRDGTPRLESGYEGDECEVGLTLAGDTPIIFRWVPERKPAAVGELSVRREGGTTVYEAALPWDLIGVKQPAPSKRLLWSLTVNDNDGDGFRGWLEWTPGICGGKDSSAFGWLRLAP